MVNYSGPLVGRFSWDTVSGMKGTTTEYLKRNPLTGWSIPQDG